MNYLKVIYALNAVNLGALILAQVVIVPILLHYLDVAGFEHWIFISTVGFILTFSDLGMIAYNSNAARMAYGQGDKSAAQTAISHGIFFLLALFVFFVFAALVLFFLIPSAKGLIWALIVLNVPFAQIKGWLTYLFTARFDQKTELAFTSGFTVLQTIVYAGTVACGGKVLALAAAQVLTQFLLGILPLLYALRRSAPDIRLTPRLLPETEIASMLKGCLSNFSYSAATIAISHLPVILLGVIPRVPAGSLAVFSVSRTLTGVVRQFGQQMGRSNGIEISRYVGPEQKQKRERLFLIGSYTISSLVAVGMGGLIPVADQVLAFWTGKPGLYDQLVILLFCLDTVAVAPLQIAMMMPQYNNRAHMMVLPTFIQIVLIAFLGAPGSYFFGATGMVAALAFAEMTTLGVVSIRKIIPEIGLRPSWFLTQIGFPSIALFVASLLVCTALRRFVQPMNFFSLLGMGGAWFVIVFPFAWLIYKFRIRHL
jgi:O-antigen/teichoic acid export membrane protein